MDVEETFLDAHQLAQKDFSWSQRLERPIPEKNLKRAGWVFFAILAGAFLRESYLVIFKNSEYSAKAKTNYVKEIWDRAPRGIIYDSKNRALVKNTLSFNLVMIPAELPRDKNSQENIVKALAVLTKLAEAEIKNQFGNIDRFSFRPLLVLEDLNHDELLTFKSQLENLPGLKLEENFKREYEGHGLFSQVLGYTGRVSGQDVKDNQEYLLTDVVGKNGLELQYDDYLRGRHGVTMVETHASGETGRVANSHPAQPGQNLVLFLDADLQKKLTEAMSQVLAGTGLARAAAVVLDPKSGGVLAMQSLPTFDSNIFASRLDQNTFNELFQNSNQPLFNRVVGGVYPPGSTVKPFIGVGALQEKVVNNQTTVDDKGFITAGGQVFKGWKALGVVDIYKAIAMSSNIFFYSVGGGYGPIAGLGPERIADYFKRFGFSKSTGIDFPSEASGFVPTPDWKRAAKHEGWFVGDTYNMSIGQGFVQVTPLQLALATTAVANRGVLFKPRMVKSITDHSGSHVKNIEPEVLSKNFVDPESLEIIRKAMHETIISGSARSLANLPGSAGGKTGTAQTGVGHNTHAWFTVFAPYEDPKIVLTVLVENGGEGSSVAVPIAREVLEWYLAR